MQITYIVYSLLTFVLNSVGSWSPVMDKILKGIMRYRANKKETMVKQFLEVKDNPKPKAVFFSCIDSRMIPTRFTQMNVGDMFIVRNAGNIIPHSQHFLDEITMNEPAALELGCVVNDIRHIVVCGHSDCKAINLLHKLQDRDFSSQVVFKATMFGKELCNVLVDLHCSLVYSFCNIPHSQHFLDEITMNEPAALELGCVVNDIRHIVVCGHSDCKAINLLHKLQDRDFSSQDNRRKSPLRAWLCAHALTSLEKLQQLSVTDFSMPLLFQAETPMRKFVAYIDPDNQFNVEDKLSQINTLQQLQNIASYGFLKRRLEKHQLHIHALWFDIYTGDIYYFSRAAKRFVPVDENNLERLMDEVERYYS